MEKKEILVPIELAQELMNYILASRTPKGYANGDVVKMISELQQCKDK